ncbi:hypothetical protein QUA56_17055 [Microcoleus sp. N3A4]
MSIVSGFAQMPIALNPGIVLQVVSEPATADCEKVVKFGSLYFSSIETPKLHQRIFPGRC